MCACAATPTLASGTWTTRSNACITYTIFQLPVIANAARLHSLIICRNSSTTMGAKGKYVHLVVMRRTRCLQLFDFPPYVQTGTRIEFRGDIKVLIWFIARSSCACKCSVTDFCSSLSAAGIPRTSPSKSTWV